MDLILNFPDNDTAFIGFFMMNQALQGKGIGSEIIRARRSGERTALKEPASRMCRNDILLWSCKRSYSTD